MILLYRLSYLYLQQVRDMTERKYTRKYLRIRPDGNINAEMTIVQVGRDMVCTGTAQVRVIDICPGGLRFTSILNLPVNSSVCLELRFQVAGMDFRLKGCIIHKCGMEVREYAYGFCFLEPDETLRTCLKRLFCNMQVKLEKHIVILRLN